MNFEAAARRAKERVHPKSFARKVKVFLQCPASPAWNAIPGLRLGWDKSALSGPAKEIVHFLGFCTLFTNDSLAARGVPNKL